MHSIYRVAKYGIIMLSCKTYAYWSAVIRIDESDRDTQPASYDEFDVFRIFGSRSLLNPKQEC